MFQSRVGGQEGVSLGAAMPCGQIGRLVQTWTSCTGPMAPSQIHSHTRRAPSLECPWLPIWETIPAFLASSASIRASLTVWVSGFWTKTCLPILMAIMAVTAWLWSGVLAVVGTMLFSLFSISRESPHLAAFLFL